MSYASESQANLVLESNEAARSVCRAISDLVAAGGEIPWPAVDEGHKAWAIRQTVETLFKTWAVNRARGLYEDSDAEATCRAIGDLVADGVTLPRVTAANFKRWAEIQRRLGNQRKLGADK